MIYSSWFPSGFREDTPVFNDALEIDAPEITEEIVTTGGILVYGRIELSGLGIKVVLLPYVNFQGVHFEYEYFELSGILLLVAVKTDGSPIGTNNRFTEFRYLIIPGGVAAAKVPGSVPSAPETGYTAEDYKKMSYEELTALFNILE